MFASELEARAAGSLPRLRALSQHLLQERIASIHARAAEEQEGGGEGGGVHTGAHQQRSSAGTRRLTQELESCWLCVVTCVVMLAMCGNMCSHACYV